MRRLPTMIAASGAAALTALAVTVSAPATGNSGGGDAEADAFVTCIRAQGLAGAPTGGLALKTWLTDRLDRGDEAVEDAMNACAPPKGASSEKREHAAPTDEQLRSCLEEHGARIEGDDRTAIKRWVAAHEDDRAARDAMKSCNLAPPGTKPAGPGTCHDKGTDERAATPAIAEN